MHQRKCCCRARELTTDRVCRLLIMGRACGSIYFIFMSQMVHVVLFMNKLGVQNTSVSKATCRMQRRAQKNELWHATFRFVGLIKDFNPITITHPDGIFPAKNWAIYFLYIILGQCPYSSFHHRQAAVKYSLFTVREVESRLVCKRPALFCSLISWLASSQDRATEVCPIKLSPVLKGPAVLGHRPLLWPKIEVTSLACFQALRPVYTVWAYPE